MCQFIVLRFLETKISPNFQYPFIERLKAFDYSSPVKYSAFPEKYSKTYGFASLYNDRKGKFALPQRWIEKSPFFAGG